MRRSRINSAGGKPDAERAAALRAEGKTIRQIAEALGCSESGAYYVLTREKRRPYWKIYDAQRRATDPEYHEASKARLRLCARKRAGIKNATGELPQVPCEICGREGLRLCCDHDHDTGEIRGWLCVACNRGLGYLQDSPCVLAAALIYLGKSGKAWR